MQAEPNPLYFLVIANCIFVLEIYTMKIEIIHSFANYNAWANNILAKALLTANEGQLEMEIISSFPSIRKTLVHIHGAESIWVQRLASLPPYTFYKGTAGISTNEEITLWLSSSDKLKDYALSLNEENLLEEKSVTNLKGEIFSNAVWQMLMHCFNHSTFHRGQIITMLRQVGVTAIPSTDLITYYRL